MSSFITRFVSNPATDLSDLLGENFPQLRELSGTELEFAVVRKYCDLVKGQGDFSYVCALPVMKPDSDAFHFYLIYATRHIKGVKVFKDVERRTEQHTHVVRADVQKRQRQEKTGKMELFEAPVLYRQRKYEQLAEDNRKRARQSVQDLIVENGRMPYDESWGEALQFPAVYERDLRSWIAEWEQRGLVSVEGRRFAKELLKPGCGHILVYRGYERTEKPR